MSGRIFVVSDTHFGQRNILTFKRDDGTPLRSFSSVEEMDETMVARWNEVVRPQDHVYHLGDVTMDRRRVEIVKRLSGHKRLVGGNHDEALTEVYMQAGFEKIFGVRVFRENEQQAIPGAVLTHIPIHEQSIPRWGINVHGHTHARIVRMTLGGFLWVSDPRYVCVSVEQIDYRPIPLDTVLKLAKARLDACGFRVKEEK